jgi:hypothetical protein
VQNGVFEREITTRRRPVFILGAIEFIENGIAGLTKLIKKTSRATV